MGTVRAEARVVIGAKMESYDAQGNLIESKPASSSQVSEVRTSRQRPWSSPFFPKDESQAHEKHTSWGLLNI